MITEEMVLNDLKQSLQLSWRLWISEPKVLLGLAHMTHLTCIGLELADEDFNEENLQLLKDMVIHQENVYTGKS